jgi:preprotein translocase subunit SecG
VFGARGAGSFLSRTTAILATLFFVTSLTLAYLATHSTEGRIGSVLDKVQVETPAVPETAPANDDVPKLPEK